MWPDFWGLVALPCKEGKEVKEGNALARKYESEDCGFESSLKSTSQIILLWNLYIKQTSERCKTLICCCCNLNSIQSIIKNGP